MDANGWKPYMCGFRLQVKIRLRELSDSQDTLETIKKGLLVEVSCFSRLLDKRDNIMWNDLLNILPAWND